MEEYEQQERFYELLLGKERKLVEAEVNGTATFKDLYIRDNTLIAEFKTYTDNGKGYVEKEVNIGNLLYNLFTHVETLKNHYNN
jgi:hypothetical protein